MEDVIVKINRVIGDRHIQSNEIFTDFCNLSRIHQDCVDNCRFIHSQPEEHNKIVWQVYTNKWTREGFAVLDVVELKELFYEWLEAQATRRTL